MSRDDLEISDEARDNQRAAANPSDWVWVIANAGSGKTHVLAERVMRLLLGGIEPSRILCLTYTKTAAANMRERVFKGLSAFATADDKTLNHLLHELGIKDISAKGKEKARRLFAEALETPGGLKIQTIHAFCEMVLRRFPLEANIAGHFELLQGQAETLLMAEARARLLLKASDRVAHFELTQAFDTVFAEAGETGFEKLIAAAIALRAELAAFVPQALGNNNDWKPLFESLGFGPNETEETLAQSMWPAGGMDDQGLRQMLDVGARSSAGNFKKYIEPDAKAALAAAHPIAKAGYLVSAFLKTDGGIYDPKMAAPAAIIKLNPLAYEQYLAAASHIQSVAGRLVDFRLIKRSTAALHLAQMLIAEYEAIKQQNGFLDFADLISRTQRLLSRPDVGAWVRYKLDSGIDHILLDEAQDTGPVQWDVLKALTEDIFDNQEHATRPRTVFVVGDPKQSIYSFQGARPESFEDQRRLYERRAKTAGLELKSVTFKASFRSAPGILKGVDDVFGQEELRKGVTSDGRGTSHDSLRPKAPGRIDVWQLERGSKAATPDDWTQRQDVEQAPLVRVAKSVAKTIARWVDTGFANPGDILILVRKRNAFIHALARELRNRQVPVAGVDRLVLLSHIAVKDLLALARICAAPTDSLSLASLLKSPAFGFTEDDLMTLALSADGAPLLEHLGLQKDEKMLGAYQQLMEWRRRAETVPPGTFFDLILGKDGLRRKFIARFGLEVDDILDEFLTAAHEASRIDVPGLDAFVEALEAAPPNIKREMDQSRNEVRILTVHGAKGLEAKHVFLVDSGGHIASPNQRPVLGLLHGFDGPLNGRDCFLWTHGDDKTSLQKKINDRHTSLAEDEYRRLLYVAMTRAENTLTVCGWRSETETRSGWAEWVNSGLFSNGSKQEIVSPEGISMMRFEPNGPVPDEGRKSQVSAENKEPFLFAALPVEPEIPRPLAPSAAALIIGVDSDDEERSGMESLPSLSPVLGNASTPLAAMERGTLIHMLLQRLPDLPVENRTEAAGRFIASRSAQFTPAEQTKIVDEAMAVIDNSAFEVLFSPGSKAEVQISGTIKLRGKNQIIAGKIDRISQSNGIVTLIDFKTGRPPANQNSIPENHVLQLALYRQLIAPLFAGHQIKAALVYTSGPKLVILEDALMNTALVKLGVELT